MYPNDAAERIIDEYVHKLRPLDLEMRRVWFKYETTGDKEALKRLSEVEIDIKKLNSDRDRFAELKKIYEVRSELRGDILRRQIEVLYLRHLPSQVDVKKLERLTELERGLGETFNNYKPNIDGKDLSLVEIDHILADSRDSDLLEKAWKSGKLVAKDLEKSFRELVSLRNEIARDLGYDDALSLAAEVSELDLDMLDKFYEEVTLATDEPFKKILEGHLKPELAKRFGVEVSNLEPWHFQNAFFQEAPSSAFGEVDLDQFYKELTSDDVIEKVRAFYSSIGVNVEQTLSNSSLFPKPGKNPHAVAWHLDPEKAGSSLLIMNLPLPPTAPKASEASTLVHELAHDINYEAILLNADMPYLLRDPNMLTEAFAMLMENQTRTKEWFVRLGVNEARAEKIQTEMEFFHAVDEIIFLRWAAVIYAFEKSFYKNPEQDIGELWWRFVERYQGLKRPEGWNNPDALAKYHIPNVSLLYYSNYAIGRVVNVMMRDLLAKKAGLSGNESSYYGHTELGTWLMSDFLAQGERYRWDDFMRRYMGELSVEAWTERYVT